MDLQRMELFLELIACDRPISYWRYDAKGNLLYSDSPAKEMLDHVLRRMGGLEFACKAEHHVPLLLGANTALMWIADREYFKEELIELHVLGPFFQYEHSTANCEAVIELVNQKASPAWGREFISVMQELPSLSLPLYSQYAVMLHYLLTGERLPTSSIEYQTEEPPAVPADFSNLKTHTPPKDRMLIYRAERALLDAVREGDLDCAGLMEQAGTVAKIREYTDNPLRNAQIACTTFAALCTRAAIEGGFSTTKSYCLGDAYIKSLFLAKSIPEVSDIKNQMYKDFVTRVHNCRSNPQYSKMVEGSRDYIELHLADPINIETLASRLGYSKYYLSTQFKKEVGCSINDYIKFARIERAKRLLSTTNKRISEIAEETGFGSRSFFASTFKHCVGKAPAQYRKETLNT